MAEDADRISLEASDWLLRLREAPADQELHESFEQWRAAHPDHAEAWNEMQDMFALIGDVQPAHPEYLVRGHDATRGRPRRESGAPATRPTITPSRRIGRTAAIAAVAACLALIAAPSLILHMQADHVTGAGSVERIALADGSSVRLGPDSAIVVSYTTDRREVRLLRGQAWFEVRPDPGRPFRVDAQDVSATVLGTAFDVRMIGEETMVAVGHGRVRVRDAAATPAQERELAAGDWVRIDQRHRLMAGSQAAELAGAWGDGTIMIRGRTVADAIEEIRPWYNGRIILANAVVGRSKVTGTYRLTEPVEALRALVEPHGGTITRITPWVVVVSGR